jgi:ferredoxin-nitrite reductase
MLRLILPGGRLTSVQLKAVAQAASELEREFITLTPSRALDLPAEFLPRLAEAGLSTRDLPAGCPGLETDAAQDPDCVGVREQEQPMLFTIGVPVPAGRLSASQARKAADLAERYAGGLLQLTSRQNLLLPDVPKERVAQVLEGLESVDLRVAASVYRRGLTACAEGVEERARELLDHLESRVPLKEPLRIHITAGACNCEQALEAEIGLRAARIQVEERMIEAYDLSVDAQPVPGAGGIPAGLVKYRLENLLVRTKRDRASGESIREFFRRIGDEEVARLLSGEVEESRSL